jgi:hypothetical protein
MRMASVGLFAALLASAAASLRRLPNPRLALAGLLVAVTPMAWFLGASVNPSGLEIGAGIATWASGIVLVHEASRRVDTRVVLRFTVAAGVLILVRHPGPIWAILIAIVLSLSATPEARRRLASSHAIRVGLSVLALCGLGQLAWILVARPFSDTHNIFSHGLHSTSQIAQSTVGQTGGWLHQMVGTFGWLDTPTPSATVLLWLLAAGGLLLAAAIRGPNRDRRTLLLTLELAFVVPVLLAAIEVFEVGPHWQARYQVPFVAGLPILAAASLSGSNTVSWRLRQAVVRLISGAVVIAATLAYAQDLRRYTVGYHGSVLFWVHPAWSPPLPALPLLAGASVALLGLTVFFNTTSSIPGDPRPPGVTNGQAQPSLVSVTPTP